MNRWRVVWLLVSCLLRLRRRLVSRLVPCLRPFLVVVRLFSSPWTLMLAVWFVVWMQKVRVLCLTLLVLRWTWLRSSRLIS